MMVESRERSPQLPSLWDSLSGREDVSLKAEFIYPLAEAPVSSSRIEGLQALLNAGARVPEMMVIGPELFESWRSHNQQYPPGTAQQLRATAKDMLARHPQGLAIRRQSRIPGCGDDPGSVHILGIKKSQLAVETIEGIFKEALGIIKECVDKGNFGSQEEIQAFENQVTVGGIIQEFVDPPPVDPQRLEKGVFPETQPLPAGFQAATYLKENRLCVRIVAVHGNNRGALSGGQVVVIETRPDGGENIEIFPHQQQKMLVTTERARKDPKAFPSGQEILPVPLNRQTDTILTIEEISEIRRVLRQLYEQTGKTLRIEGARGLDQGELRLYFLQALPFALDEELLKSYEALGKVLCLEWEKDLETLGKVLEKPIPEGAHLFIHLPADVMQEDKRDLYYLLANLLRSHQQKERVIVLAGTDSSTAHVNTNLVDAGIRYVCVGQQQFIDGTTIRLDVRGLKFDAKIIEAREDKGVVPLMMADLVEIRLVGDKAANLARLARAGLVVPDGFVIHRGMVEEIINRCGAADLLRKLREAKDPKEAVAIGEDICACLKSVPRPVMKYINRGLAELKRGNGFKTVMVRSSALGEDGQSAFAGVFTSHEAWIMPQDLIYKRGKEAIRNFNQAVLAVIKSLFSKRAIRHIFSTDPQVLKEIGMQVLIQKKIPGPRVVVRTQYGGVSDNCLVSYAKEGTQATVSGEVATEELVFNMLKRRPDAVPEIFKNFDFAGLVEIIAKAKRVIGEEGQPIELELVLYQANGEKILVCVQGRGIRA